MKPFLQRAAVTLRGWGYSGSGQNYRRLVEDNVFVVNFQKSRDGRGFYVNLGGQPCSIPDEGESDANPKTLKEHECVFRQRLPGEYSVNISAEDTDALLATLGATRETFEAKILSMRELSRRGLGPDLFDQRRFMGPAPRAALILARLLAADGHGEGARRLAEFAVSNANGARLLQAAAERLLATLGVAVE
jgi:hypothetical protein